MKVAYRETSPTRGKSAHRAGGISFIALLQGEENAVDNFDLSISITTDEFSTPRHRHNFDQVRLILEGEFSFDRGRVQKAGQISYFGESTYYEQKGIGYTETLLLQTAGAGGSGYMSFDQLYETATRLTSKGKFEDGVFTWFDADGTKHNVDGYQAVWEEVNGRKLAYSKPRYDTAVILNPEHFQWLALAGTTGVQVRELAHFHERGLAVAELRLEAGAEWLVSGTPGRNALFVLDGVGEVEGQPLRRHAAVQVERAESVRVRASTPMRVLRIKLPVFDQAIAA